LRPRELPLADEARTRGAPGDDSAHDAPAPAGETAFTGSPVHAVLGLEPPRRTVNVDVLGVVESAAAGGNRRRENVVNCGVQPAHCIGTERRGHTIVAQSGTVEDFVGIDVADAGDGVLIEQQCLQVAPPPAQDAAQRRDVETLGDRIGT
jgi:hypothetical protein